MLVERTGEVSLGSIVGYAKCPCCGKQAIVYSRYEKVRIWERRGERLVLVETSVLRLEKDLLYCPYCGFQTLIY